MRVLDLFCGAGGAAMGYHLAGFDEIVGVDIVDQPRFPFRFVRGDALDLPSEYLAGFDLIHASPPCQAYSTLRHAPGAVKYPDLVEPTRALLTESNSEYVIENVPGAPLIDPIRLCGSMFDLWSGKFELRRHRIFETSWEVAPPRLCSHGRPVLGVYGDLSRNSRPSNRGVKAGIAQAEEMMGIDWMDRKELVQAIPPAYSRYLGGSLIAELDLLEVPE